MAAEPTAAVLFGWTVAQLHTHPGLTGGPEVAGEPFSLKRHLSPFRSTFPAALTALSLVVSSLWLKLLTWVKFRERKARELSCLFNL